VSHCFVALDDHGTIAGYDTFAATSLPLMELPAETAKLLPRYELMPAGLIGRLAVDRKFQGKRLGGALIMDAAPRAARSDAVIFALLVDAKKSPWRFISGTASCASPASPPRCSCPSPSLSKRSTPSQRDERHFAPIFRNDKHH
jgi:GNAT superfamily N-acetyltransferase